DRQRPSHLHGRQGLSPDRGDQGADEGARQAPEPGPSRPVVRPCLGVRTDRGAAAAMIRLLSALAAAALALAAPAAAEPLKKVPAALNPAKAYVLVEYKLEKNPFANWPGSRKTMPLQAG